MKKYKKIEESLMDDGIVSKHVGVGISIGLAMGMSLGIVFGAATDNIAVGMTIGMSMGMCIGVAIGYAIGEDKGFLTVRPMPKKRRLFQSKKTDNS